MRHSSIISSEKCIRRHFEGSVDGCGVKVPSWQLLGMGEENHKTPQ
jgi:hypothetical protein